MKNFVFITLVALVLAECTTSKLKIGDYAYKVNTERVNTGDPIRSPKGRMSVKGDIKTFE